MMACNQPQAHPDRCGCNRTEASHGPVCFCGLAKTKNPHPDAGKPERILEVGAVYECIPCLTKSRHEWSQRAIAAEQEAAGLRAQLDQLQSAGNAVEQVQVTSHLDEIDAPVWPFINEEALKVGAEHGHIETYKYERANGGVAVLWDANRIHAMAVTVRDSRNRTRCIRMLAANEQAMPLADQAYMQAINCPHTINDDEVVLRFDPTQPGHNALNQLARRLAASSSTARAKP